MKNKTFAGIEEQYSELDNAAIVLIPVTYDGTSTWQKGANKGYDAFQDASENMELYDIETDSEVYKVGIYTADVVAESSSPDAMVEAVHQNVKKYLIKNKFVTLFGGEHSISIGAIRAFNEYYRDLTVLHIDAHADLRKSYQGSIYNHACAMHEASINTNLIQVGIRSMDISEKKYMNMDQVYFAQDFHSNGYWMEEALEQMSNNVYISFDLDALDPSIMPSTGTPEPGGLLWNDTLEFLKEVIKTKNVVGFDIVELCPNSNNKAPDFLAAKLYYKMLSYKFMTDDDSIADYDNGIKENQLNGKRKFKSTDDEY